MTFLLDLATQTILLSLFLFFTASRQKKGNIWWRTRQYQIIAYTKPKPKLLNMHEDGDIHRTTIYFRNIDFGCHVKKHEEESLLLDWKKRKYIAFV